MPTIERVRELVRYVESGRTEEALMEFYTGDVAIAENLLEPTIGLEANVARERAFAFGVSSVNEYRAVSFLIGDDQSAINWSIDLSLKDGRRLRLNEIAWQDWRGDRICKERFVYDTATVPVHQMPSNTDSVA